MMTLSEVNRRKVRKGKAEVMNLRLDFGCPTLNFLSPIIRRPEEWAVKMVGVLKFY
jgi:hypothetical protein